MPILQEQIERAIGVAVRSLTPLSGGCIAEVHRADLADGRSVVVKSGPEPTPSRPGLEPEGFMLRYLREHTALPVPRVLHVGDRLLVMEHIETDSRGDAIEAERHAAELLAELHAIPSPDFRFGFERSTLIGPLVQPNPWTDSWIDFFREERLLMMSAEASRGGRLDAAFRNRIDSVAEKLEELIDEPAAGPSLIHGDVWSGNILRRGGKIAGFIDPSLSFSHPEIELAFITLFSTFGPAFFARYGELREDAGGAPDTGFFETRRHVYNLFPLLVHVRLFGGAYVGQLDDTLELIGF